MEEKGNILLYQTENGETKIEVTLSDNTVWLKLDQMAVLFQRDKSTISRHIKNVFDSGELQSNSVVAYFATTASDEKTYQVAYYNPDSTVAFFATVQKEGTREVEKNSISFIKN